MPAKTHSLIEEFRERCNNYLSLQEVQTLYSDYGESLSKRPFGQLQSPSSAIGTIKFLKRDTAQQIGPYQQISIFEAANRIASDLVLLKGVIQILKSQKKMRRHFCDLVTRM